MEVTIKGEPKDIAALVEELQKRQEQEVITAKYADGTTKTIIR